MAGVKITDLNALTTPIDADILAIVDDVAGSAETKKITLENLLLGSSNIIPSARVYNSANISLGNGAETTITHNTEVYDTDAIYDGGATDRLTCKTAGKYLIIGIVSFAANANGNRMARILHDGSTPIGIFRGEAIEDGTAGNTVVASVIYDLAVNDYVVLKGYQNSGGALNALTGGTYLPSFMMTRIGD